MTVLAGKTNSVAKFAGKMAHFPALATPAMAIERATSRISASEIPQNLRQILPNAENEVI